MRPEVNQTNPSSQECGDKRKIISICSITDHKDGVGGGWSCSFVTTLSIPLTWTPSQGCTMGCRGVESIGCLVILKISIMKKTCLTSSTFKFHSYDWTLDCKCNYAKFLHLLSTTTVTTEGWFAEFGLLCLPLSQIRLTIYLLIIEFQSLLVDNMVILIDILIRRQRDYASNLRYQCKYLFCYINQHK